MPSLLTFQQLAAVFGTSMAVMLEEVPVGNNALMVAALMKNLSPEELAFFIETFKRYRALVRQQRKPGGAVA